MRPPQRRYDLSSTWFKVLAMCLFLLNLVQHNLHFAFEKIPAPRQCLLQLKFIPPYPPSQLIQELMCLIQLDFVSIRTSISISEKFLQYAGAYSIPTNTWTPETPLFTLLRRFSGTDPSHTETAR
jgi:hypothetical protein